MVKLDLIFESSKLSQIAEMQQIAKTFDINTTVNRNSNFQNIVARLKDNLDRKDVNKLIVCLEMIDKQLNTLSQKKTELIE